MSHKVWQFSVWLRQLSWGTTALIKTKGFQMVVPELNILWKSQKIMKKLVVALYLFQPALSYILESPVIKWNWTHFQCNNNKFLQYFLTWHVTQTLTKFAGFLLRTSSKVKIEIYLANSKKPILVFAGDDCTARFYCTTNVNITKRVIYLICMQL